MPPPTTDDNATVLERPFALPVNAYLVEKYRRPMKAGTAAAPALTGP